MSPHPCVSHDCLLTTVSLSPLSLPHYVWLTTVHPHHCVSSLSPAHHCVSSLLCLTHHCLWFTTLSPHHCVWLTGVSLPIALEHGLQDRTISHMLISLIRRAEGSWGTSISTAQIIPTENHPSDQRGHGAQQCALGHGSSGRAPNNSVCLTALRDLELKKQ